MLPGAGVVSGWEGDGSRGRQDGSILLQPALVGRGTPEAPGKPAELGHRTRALVAERRGSLVPGEEGRPICDAVKDSGLG